MRTRRVSETVLANRAVRAMLLPALRADLACDEHYEYVPEPPLAVPVTVLSGADDPLVWREVSDRLGCADHGSLHHPVDVRRALLRLRASRGGANVHPERAEHRTALSSSEGVGRLPVGPAVPPREEDRAYRWAALVVLCLSVVIINLDNTILNVALPTLVRKLHASSSQLQWIVDSYAMVFAGLVLVGGSLADRFGRKRFFLIGLTVFAAGSVGGALSGSVQALIACRAVMGVGAALTMPSTLSIINDTFRDPRERARAIGAWAGAAGIGVAIGPIAGGLLLARFWWGSVFLVNVPIVIVALVGALALVRDSKNPVAEPPDPGGAVLSIAGLGLLLWAIIEAPTDGWSSRA